MNPAAHWYSITNRLIHCIGYYEAFFVLCLVLGAFSRRFRKFLELDADDAFIVVFTSIYRWFFRPISQRLLVLVSLSHYRKGVLRSVEKEIHASYKVKLNDLAQQIKLIEEDRNRWKDAANGSSSDRTYWDGMKYGHSLRDRNKRKGKEVPLTDSHMFSLKEIAGGNKTVNGLIPAYLEDYGYVRLVWDDEKAEKYHYEITDKGRTTLNNLQGIVETPR